MADVMSEARSEDFSPAMPPAGPVIKEKKVIYYQTPSGSEPSMSESTSMPGSQKAADEIRDVTAKVSGISPSRSAPSDVVAGLTHFQILTIMGALAAWWLLTSHYILAAFGGGLIYAVMKFPRQSSLILLAVGVPTFLIWIVRHAFTALFLAGISSLLYFFADEEAKVRMNIAARRFWHSFSRVLQAAQHNTSLLAHQAKSTIVERVDRASAAAAATTSSS
jgi:hypothetical protein